MNDIGFPRAIAFSELELVFIEIAPLVFDYFGKGGAGTVMTERYDGGGDDQERAYTKHTLVNEAITVEILQEVRLHDNSMTSEWLYKISISVFMGGEILYMFNELTQPRLHKLYYRSDSRQQGFAAHYLASLQARLNE